MTQFGIFGVGDISPDPTTGYTQSEAERITDLIDDALLTQAGVSRPVARLEQRGLVERRPDPDDARAYRLFLAADGHEVQWRLGRTHARHVTAAMTRALAPEQLHTLRELMRALVAATPATQPPPPPTPRKHP
ncbi:MarR family transcriptional regulator [Streptomyces sp. NPDC050704]|uniref:MarR family winged helix-turn-helix transcriptional regulator n=1 Tax=Streptomyces sp. NPDC050704 TaxID=3157219 RepID=UPI00341D30EA